MGKRGNSALVSSNRQSSSGREMFSVLVGRWWVTVKFVQLTVDCSTPVEWRQGMNGRPGLIVWRAGRVEFWWLTSAFDRGHRRRLPSRCCRPGRMELCHWDVRTQRRSRIRSDTCNQWRSHRRGVMWLRGWQRTCYVIHKVTNLKCGDSHDS